MRIDMRLFLNEPFHISDGNQLKVSISTDPIQPNPTFNLEWASKFKFVRAKIILEKCVYEDQVRSPCSTYVRFVR